MEIKPSAVINTSAFHNVELCEQDLIPRDRAHEVQGACMKGQHKALADGTGVGKGWILSQNIGKAQWGAPQNPFGT